MAKNQTAQKNNEKLLEEFHELLDKKNITLSDTQEIFVESIFYSKAFVLMTASRTGKSWLFEMIDNFMSDGVLEQDIPQTIPYAKQAVQKLDKIILMLKGRK